MMALTQSPAARFALRFFLLSGVLLGLYYFPYGQGAAARNFLDGYLRAYASVAGGVLRLFEPTLVVHGQEIIGRYSLRIVKTCDAMDTQILFVSAVAAWPGGWRPRVIAAVLGALVLFVINIARICSLYYIGIMMPASFDVVHLEVWPAVIVIACVAGFVGFAAWMRNHEGRPAGWHELV
jgi:exosortase/archaeosortase family protein